MERNNFWIFLGIGLALGFCLEVLKSPAGKSSVRLAGFTRFQTILDEGREVSVPTEKESAPLFQFIRKNKKEEVIVPHQLTAEELPPTAETTQTPVAAAPAPKPETEEEKKKRLAAEKKKKKEEKKKIFEEWQKNEMEAQKARDLNAQLAEAMAKGKDGENENVNNNGAENQPANYANAQPPANNNDDHQNSDLKTAAEWEAYLTKSADHGRMQQFIKALHDGDVSNEVYFTVLRAMIEDHRSEIHQLALMGLAAAPSVKSFELLVSISSNDSNAAVKNQALAMLSSYEQPGTVRILGQVIGADSTSSHASSSSTNSGNSGSSSHSTALLLAIQHFQQSVDKNLRPSTSATGGTSTSNPAALAAVYQPFTSALARVAQTGPTPEIKAAAQAALSDLQTQLAAYSAPASSQMPQPSQQQAFQ